MGSTGWIISTASPEPRSAALRCPGPASSCTSTSRSWVGSPKAAAGGSTAAPANRHAAANRTKIGYAFVHSAVDGYSRLAYSEVLANEQGATAAQFWCRAAASSPCIDITSNASSPTTAPATAAVSSTCRLGPPPTPSPSSYRPQTNGKVERFNRTLHAEWAYARPWRSDGQRTRALTAWLHLYNHHRHHTAIGGPPITRIRNVLGHYS